MSQINANSNSNSNCTVYFVVPCYNEEEILRETAKKLSEKILSMGEKNRLSLESRIVFIDDGSKDKTWEIIEELNLTNPLVQGIKLAHNRGHQNALLAGLSTAVDKCDCAITLDADLQDNIEVLDEFIEKYTEGCEIVYGVRNNRKKDTFFKKTTAEGFYKVMKSLGTEIVFNHADYRLMSNTAISALLEYKEVNLFLRGIVPIIGYRTDYVYYDRQERTAGETKYPFGKMVTFAIDGITSFSVKPLSFISGLGIIISIMSIFGLLYALVSYFSGHAVAGWTATVSSIWLLGGLQMLCLGVVGTYIGKIYSEVKMRPRFKIEKYLNEEKKE